MKFITSLLAALALVFAGVTLTGCTDRDTPHSTPPEMTPSGGGAAPATPPPAPAN